MIEVKIINYDMMFKLKGGIPVSIPRNKCIEQLRYVDGKIIDLVELDTIHVERKNGVFILHATELYNTQPIKMKYKDRKRLYMNKKGEIKLKTKKEIEDEFILKKRSANYPELNEQVGAIMDYLKNKDDLTPEMKELLKKIDEVKEKYKKTD